MIEEFLVLWGIFLNSAVSLLPYFLFAVVLGVLMNTARLDRRVVALFERAGLWSVVGAVLLGVVSPL
jgi:uncharacterized membrane protein YraQ (UPF0718 family)